MDDHLTVMTPRNASSTVIAEVQENVHAGGGTRTPDTRIVIGA